MQFRLLKTKAARQVADAIMANDMFTRSELLVFRQVYPAGVARYNSARRAAFPPSRVFRHAEYIHRKLLVTSFSSCSSQVLRHAEYIQPRHNRFGTQS